jgi:hypothetical protein
MVYVCHDKIAKVAKFKEDFVFPSLRNEVKSRNIIISQKNFSNLGLLL